MKHLPILFICTAVFVFTASPLFAQNGITFQNNGISVKVSAEVLPAAVELVTIQSMNLSSEDVENDVITIHPQISGNAGKMIAIGSPETKISIRFLESRELVHSRGSGTLTFNYRIAGNTVDDQSTAEILDRDNRELEFNSEGEFYLWIGGSVDISTAEPGNYRGEFTLEIEYI